MNALLRFLRADPVGAPADGRALGLGLSAALRKHYSAEEADRYLELWSATAEGRGQATPRPPAA